MGLWFWIGVAFVSWGLASFFGKMVAPYFAPRTSFGYGAS